jgi:hypothetical protein
LTKIPSPSSAEKRVDLARTPHSFLLFALPRRASIDTNNRDPSPYRAPPTPLTYFYLEISALGYKLNTSPSFHSPRAVGRRTLSLKLTQPRRALVATTHTYRHFTSRPPWLTWLPPITSMTQLSPPAHTVVAAPLVGALHLHFQGRALTSTLRGRPAPRTATLLLTTHLT